MDELPTARLQTPASYSFTMRLHLAQEAVAFARVAHAIGEAEAMLGAIDLVRVESDHVVRDVTVACVDATIPTRWSPPSVRRLGADDQGQHRGGRLRRDRRARPRRRRA